LRREWRATEAILAPAFASGRPAVDATAPRIRSTAHAVASRRDRAYYIDGQLFGTHDSAYLPERPMSINFNQWLIDLAGRTGTTARAYDEQVDYVLHVKDQVLTPAQVAAKVTGYRSAGTTFEDTVPSS
jgi:hypothetical protein